MTALEMITRKGFNPFKTEMVKKGRVYIVRDKDTKKEIVRFTYTPDGIQKVLA